MDANEMRDAFLTRYDKLDSLSSPSIEDSEIEEFMNQAQDRKFTHLYMPEGNPTGLGFEMSEKRRRDLSELVKTDNSTTASSSQIGVHTNGIFYDLPTDFLYAIEESLVINTVSVPIKPIEHDYYLSNINNPYKQPSMDVSWRLNISREDHGTGIGDPSDKRVEIITHGPTPTTYFVRYLAYPRRIVINVTTPASSVSCQLDESLHDSIIDEAVKIATGITMPELYNIKSNEANNID